MYLAIISMLGVYQNEYEFNCFHKINLARSMERRLNSIVRWFQVGGTSHCQNAPFQNALS